MVSVYLAVADVMVTMTVEITVMKNDAVRAWTCMHMYMFLGTYFDFVVRTHKMLILLDTIRDCIILCL